MKSLLLIASVLLVSNSLFAEVVDVNVAQGYKVIEISSSFSHSGCSSQTNFLDVLKTENGYAAGLNIAIKKEGEVWENVMPRLIVPPIYTCMAIVTTTNTIKFKHRANNDEVIQVDVPLFMTRNLKVEVTDVQLAH